MVLIWLWKRFLTWWRSGRGPQQQPPTSDRLFYVTYFRGHPDARIELLWKAVALVGDAGLVGIALAVAWAETFATVLSAGWWLVVSGAAMAIRYDHERTKAGLLPKPTDAEMDERLAGLLDEVDREALAALHLTRNDIITRGVGWSAAHAVRGHEFAAADRDGRPLLVLTPVLTSRSAIGNDLGWRFARWQVVALCPTAGQLGVFRCRVDVVTGKIADRETDEYYYPELTAVQTRAASTDGVVFAPVNHSPFGVDDLPKLGGKALHVAGPGVDRTVLVATHTPRYLRQPPKQVTTARTTQPVRTTEPLHIALYPTGLDHATEQLRGWLRRDWAA